ncbi:MAG: cobalamin-dependent protein, partial [Candidatus Omnitrophica bacterium]|nr:cobalamin-dependent protein [Candidatus Omnitrophota bacterium]
MKVMFVYPAFENIGIEYLSAVLKQNGFQTKIAFDPLLFNDQFIRIKGLNTFFNYEKNLLTKIKNYDPKIVAFSVLSSTYPWALNLARKIKSFSSAHIIFGGIHPSSAPEEVISQECVDSIAIGEGEFAILELANSLKHNKVDYAIKNIWFKDRDRIIRNPLRPYIEDLD